MVFMTDTVDPMEQVGNVDGGIRGEYVSCEYGSPLLATGLPQHDISKVQPHHEGDHYEGCPKEPMLRSECDELSLNLFLCER